MVLPPWCCYGKKLKIKIYSNPYWKNQERRRTDTFMLNCPLLIFLCPPRWVSLIYLLLHPKNCQQIWVQPLPCKKAPLNTPPVFLHKLSDLYSETVGIYCSSDALKLHENGFAHIKLLLPAAPALYLAYLCCSYQNVGFGVFFLCTNTWNTRKKTHDLFMHLQVYR